MHENAERLFRKYAVPYFDRSSRVLEVGPDWVPSTLQRAVDGRFHKWETIDLRGGPEVGKRSHYMESEEVLPLATDSFDVVVSSSVIEHVRRPWRWLPELARVCRPGGVVITISPVSWPEHKDDFVRFDCWRILPDGMRVLAEDAGLDVVQIVHNCLESVSLRGRWYPGETYRFSEPARGRRVAALVSAAHRVTRFPRSAAVDCITIAQKAPRK